MVFVALALNDRCTDLEAFYWAPRENLYIIQIDKVSVNALSEKYKIYHTTYPDKDILFYNSFNDPDKYFDNIGNLMYQYLNLPFVDSVFTIHLFDNNENIMQNKFSFVSDISFDFDKKCSDQIFNALTFAYNKRKEEMGK